MSDTSTRTHPGPASPLRACILAFRQALGAYRGWANGSTHATTFAAVSAEAITHLDVIARAGDTVLDRLTLLEPALKEWAFTGDDGNRPPDLSPAGWERRHASACAALRAAWETAGAGGTTHG